jgi:hypothetical protein
MGTEFTNNKGALGQARPKKEQALARLRALQSDALEGKLLYHEQVQAQWARAFAGLRDRGLVLADRIVSRGALKIAASRSAFRCLKVGNIGVFRCGSGIRLRPVLVRSGPLQQTALVRLLFFWPCLMSGFPGLGRI